MLTFRIFRSAQFLSLDLHSGKKSYICMKEHSYLKFSELMRSSWATLHVCHSGCLAAAHTLEVGKRQSIQNH